MKKRQEYDQKERAQMEIKTSKVNPNLKPYGADKAVFKPPEPRKGGWGWAGSDIVEGIYSSFSRLATTCGWDLKMVTSYFFSDWKLFQIRTNFIYLANFYFPGQYMRMNWRGLVSLDWTQRPSNADPHQWRWIAEMSSDMAFWQNSYQFVFPFK